MTVLVGAESAVEQGSDRYETAWKAMAQQLEQQAVRKAQVQALLVTTGADQSTQLWFGEDLTQLGLTPEEVTALGADSPQQAPLVSVLLRAALVTGADVQLVPHQSEQAARRRRRRDPALRRRQHAHLLIPLS